MTHASVSKSERSNTDCVNTPEKLHPISVLHASLASSAYAAPDLILSGAEKNFSRHEVGALAAHAAIVYHQLYELKKNAREVCVSLKQCKDAYIAAVREIDPSKKYVGWNAFCKNNFSSLGLSERNIRAAVKTGEVLLEMKEQSPDTYDAISELSRDALFVIGSKPEVASKVSGIIKQDPDAKFTAAQLRDMASHIQATDQTLQALEAQLAEARKAKQRAESSTATMNNLVKDYENEISRLQHQCEDKNNSHISSVDESNHVKLRDEARQKKQELARTERKLQRTTEELTKVQLLLQQQQECESVIRDLSADITGMLSKYTVALVATVSNTNPAVRKKLVGIADQLVALADQLVCPSEEKKGQ